MTSAPETRSSLLIRLRDPQDQQAWTTFLEIYEPLIYRLIRQRRVQDADAREVTQEVILAIASAIPRWDTDPCRGSFRGWVTTITRNLVVNFLIKQSRHPRGSGDSDFRLMLEQRPDAECEESAFFDVEEKRQIFRWAAERIRQDFRETHWKAFWRTAVDGVNAAEVASELSISVGLVYVSRNRVMKRLRNEVEKYRDAVDRS